MDSPIEPRPNSVEDVIAKWSSCKSCVLAANRKVPILPIGSRSPLAVMVLDRISGRTSVTGDISSGAVSRLLGSLLGSAGVSPEQVWLTPNIMCPPTRISPSASFSSGEVDILPASPAGAKACRGRVQDEIHILSPEVVICFGATSLRSVFLGNPPSHGGSVGKVIEGEIQGDVCRYRIPVMATYSLHAVYVDSLRKSGIWNKTIDHIRDAMSVATTMEGYNGLC